jgi:ribosome-associated heat shock protein Hsp15
MASIRIDKWLWAARSSRRAHWLHERVNSAGFNPTGSLPRLHARSGLETCLRVTYDGGDFQVEVLLLSEVRGPASVAQTLYRETEASRALRQKLADERKTMQHFEAAPEGRPSKRDRREIIRFRGRE